MWPSRQASADFYNPCGWAWEVYRQCCDGKIFRQMLHLARLPLPKSTGR